MTERMVFQAMSETYGFELYIMSADGQSISPLTDVNPAGAANIFSFRMPTSFAVTWPGDRLLLRTSLTDNGDWVWVTDGTAAGTYSLGILAPDSVLQGGSGRAITSTSGYVYLSGYSGGRLDQRGHVALAHGRNRGRHARGCHHPRQDKYIFSYRPVR